METRQESLTQFLNSVVLQGADWPGCTSLQLETTPREVSQNKIACSLGKREDFRSDLVPLHLFLRPTIVTCSWCQQTAVTLVSVFLERILLSYLVQCEVSVKWKHGKTTSNFVKIKKTNPNQPLPLMIHKSWDMIDYRSYTNSVSSCEIKAWKKNQAWTGFEPMTAAISVQCSSYINWAIKSTGSWSLCELVIYT